MPIDVQTAVLDSVAATLTAWTPLNSRRGPRRSVIFLLAGFRLHHGGIDCGRFIFDITSGKSLFLIK